MTGRTLRRPQNKTLTAKSPFKVDCNMSEWSSIYCILLHSIVQVSTESSDIQCDDVWCILQQHLYTPWSYASCTSTVGWTLCHPLSSVLPRTSIFRHLPSCLLVLHTRPRTIIPHIRRGRIQCKFISGWKKISHTSSRKLSVQAHIVPS